MTAQGNITAGGGTGGNWGEGGRRRCGLWKPVICIQLFLSSCPAPLFLLLPLLYLFLYPLLFYSSVAVASLRLQDPFKHFKEVVFCSQAPRPAARGSWSRLQEAEIIANGANTMANIKIKPKTAYDIAPIL